MKIFLRLKKEKNTLKTHRNCIYFLKSQLVDILSLHHVSILALLISHLQATCFPTTHYSRPDRVFFVVQTMF